jgi:hypothetical protein
VGEYFPSIEQIAAQVREAEARPSQWHAKNIQMVEEFLAKTRAAGIEPPVTRPWEPAISDCWLMPGAEGRRYNVQYLRPDPPEWIVQGIGGSGYDTYVSFTRYALGDLPGLEKTNPADLHAALMSLIPA